jgi:hypothetical protein
VTARTVVGFRPNAEDERCLARIRKITGTDSQAIRWALRYLDKCLDREGQVVPTAVVATAPGVSGPRTPCLCYLGSPHKACSTHRATGACPSFLDSRADV